jgi:hypothetical protein
VKLVLGIDLLVSTNFCLEKLKAPQNRHTGRMLWQAKAFCTKLEGIIKTFAEEVEYAIQNESKAKNVQNNRESYPIGVNTTIDTILTLHLMTSAI